MDLNLIVICGRVAAPAEIVDDERTARILVVVRSGERVDLLPVIHHAPGADVRRMTPGQRVWVCGSIERRPTSVAGRNRLELVALRMEFGSPRESGHRASPG